MEKITTESLIGLKDFYQSLANNGIQLRTGEHFNQLNDYVKHETFYQCRNCKSLNVEVIRTVTPTRFASFKCECIDCGTYEICDLVEQQDGDD